MNFIEDKMGGPRLTPKEIERRDRENRRYSALFRRIKKLFSNQELKTILNEHLKTRTFSSYLVANVSNITSRLFDNKNIDPYILSDDEFKRKILEEVTPHIDDEVQVIEVVNVEDDTGPFPRIQQEEMKIDHTPQITEEMEYYENFELTPEEKAEAEKIIREDRKNELRKLAFSKHLHQETYYLINKQFEREIEKHPPKNIPIKIFDEIPDETIIQKHL
jgi:hypothetical protein